MKKLILSLATAAIVSAGFGAYKAYEYYQPKNNLLAMNLEALAQDESGERKKGDEYHRGLTGTNWKLYEVLCEGSATQVSENSNKYEWKFDAVSGAYNVVVKASYSGGGSSEDKTETHYETTYWYRSVCGKGSGLCYDDAPDGHPCAESDK